GRGPPRRRALGKPLRRLYAVLAASRRDRQAGARPARSLAGRLSGSLARARTRGDSKSGVLRPGSQLHLLWQRTPAPRRRVGTGAASTPAVPGGVEREGGGADQALQGQSPSFSPRPDTRVALSHRPAGRSQRAAVPGNDRQVIPAALSRGVPRLP